MYLDTTGKRVHVLRFSVVGMALTRLHEFGCPIAVTLYLHFLVEGACVFLLMACISLPTVIDAAMRNARRQECRTLATLGNQSAPGTPAALADCGYASIAVREQLPLWAGYHFYLLPALGTCSEYARRRLAHTHPSPVHHSRAALLRRRRPPP